MLGRVRNWPTGFEVEPGIRRDRTEWIRGKNLTGLSVYYVQEAIALGANENLSHLAADWNIEQNELIHRVVVEEIMW